MNYIKIVIENIKYLLVGDFSFKFQKLNNRQRKSNKKQMALKIIYKYLKLHIIKYQITKPNKQWIMYYFCIYKIYN